MGKVKLLRTKLAFSSLTPPKMTLVRAPSLSHPRIFLSPTLPTPPPETRDLPDSSMLWPNFHLMPRSPPSPPKLRCRTPSPSSFSGPPPDSPEDQLVLLWFVIATCVLAGHSGGPGVKPFLPFRREILLFLHFVAPPPPCIREQSFWAWPSISLRFRLSIFIGLVPLGGSFIHDIFVLPIYDGIPHDGARELSAELFASPFFWMMYNISLSSFCKERTFLQFSLSLRGETFSIQDRVNFTTSSPLCYLV